MNTKWAIDESSSQNQIPGVLPAKWKPVRGMPGAFAHSGTGLAVISSVLVSEEYGKWLHVSCSLRNKKLPDYADMQIVKRIFIGPLLDAIEVHPRVSRHVNACEVRHLWSRIDGETCPDFRTDGQI